MPKKCRMQTHPVECRITNEDANDHQDTGREIRNTNRQKKVIPETNKPGKAVALFALLMKRARTLAPCWVSLRTRFSAMFANLSIPSRVASSTNTTLISGERLKTSLSLSWSECWGKQFFLSPNGSLMSSPLQSANKAFVFQDLCLWRVLRAPFGKLQTTTKLFNEHKRLIKVFLIKLSIN